MWKVTIENKLHISTWGHVVRSVAEGVVPRLEHERYHTGRAMLSYWCIREGIIEHVNLLVHEGVPVYLVP